MRPHLTTFAAITQEKSAIFPWAAAALSIAATNHCLPQADLTRHRAQLTFVHN
jgi:hypothetical protein